MPDHMPNVTIVSRAAVLVVSRHAFLFNQSWGRKYCMSSQSMPALKVNDFYNYFINQNLRMKLRLSKSS